MTPLARTYLKVAGYLLFLLVGMAVITSAGYFALFGILYAVWG